MMSSTSSCMDGYGNFMMHQQQVSSNFYNQSSNQQRYQNVNGSYGYPNEWAGAPLIKSSSESRHKKLYSSRSNGCEFDENSMSRLAKHTHGAPIIMSSRYRNKSSKPTQSFGHESNTVRNQNSSKAPPSSDEMNSYEDSGYHANGTCLPRIIKPRKRRKKDRKPINGAPVESNPLSPFTFSANQSNGFMQSAANNNANNNNSNVFQNQLNGNFKRPAPPNDSNLFFNCDFDPSIVLPLPSSTSSSPISLSNSSLSSSTTTSSCSCRLCDPNCKIWAFPLRRSFSDNSAAELDHHSSNGNSDGAHIETSKKDVGVIGGNRVKTEWNHSGESTFSILDMIEFSDYNKNQHHLQHHQQQQSTVTDVNRLRSESLSDSGDSGCDLLLGGLNIADDLLSSTIIKSVGDNSISAITQQLSDFSIIASTTSDTKEIKFIDKDSSHLDANECVGKRVSIDNSPTFQFNTITKSLSSCEFGDQQRRRSNLDNLLAMDMTASGSTSSCNYGNLMSPMLVNKQNYNNIVDLNNNHHGQAPAGDGCSMVVDLKERTSLFDCFDVTWKGS